MAVAGNAGDAEDFAAPQSEREVAQRNRAVSRRGCDAFERQNRLAGGHSRRGGRLTRRLFAEHHAEELGLARLAGGRRADDPALAHHHHPVGAGRHFAQLVGDVDDAITFAAEIGEAQEQAFRLLRRQNLGRLVENEHARPGQQLLENLDLLLVADGEPADRQVQIRFEPEPIRQRAHAAAH